MFKSFLVAVALVFSSNAAAWEETVSLGFDARIEALSVVAMLSEPGSTPPAAPHSRRYYENARAVFATQDSHPAVRRYGRWIGAGWRPDRIAEFVLSASPLPELRVPAKIRTEGLPSDAERASFLAELRDFAASAVFRKFLSSGTETRAGVVAEVRAEAARGVDPEAMRAYLGAPFSPYRVIPVPLIRASGNQMALYLDGDTVTMARFINPRGGYSFDDYGMSLAHELAHTVTRHWSRAHGKEVAEVPAPANCHSSGGFPWNCLDEHIVRAVEYRLLLERQSRGVPLPRMFNLDNFPFQDALVAELAAYEADRGRYKTLGDFYPRLLSAIRAQAALKQPE